MTNVASILEESHWSKDLNLCSQQVKRTNWNQRK